MITSARRREGSGRDWKEWERRGCKGMRGNGLSSISQGQRQEGARYCAICLPYAWVCNTICNSCVYYPKEMQKIGTEGNSYGMSGQALPASPQSCRVRILTYLSNLFRFGADQQSQYCCIRSAALQSTRLIPKHSPRARAMLFSMEQVTLEESSLRDGNTGCSQGENPLR